MVFCIRYDTVICHVYECVCVCACDDDVICNGYGSVYMCVYMCVCDDAVLIELRGDALNVTSCMYVMMM